MNFKPHKAYIGGGKGNPLYGVYVQVLNRSDRTSKCSVAMLEDRGAYKTGDRVTVPIAELVDKRPADAPTEFRNVSGFNPGDDVFTYEMSFTQFSLTRGKVTDVGRNGVIIGDGKTMSGVIPWGMAFHSVADVFANARARIASISEVVTGHEMIESGNSEITLDIPNSKT